MTTTWNSIEEIKSAAETGDPEAWATLSGGAHDNLNARAALLDLEARGLYPVFDKTKPAGIKDFLVSLPLARQICDAIQEAIDDAKA